MNKNRVVFSSLIMSLTILFNLFAVNAEKLVSLTDNNTCTLDGYDYTLWKDSNIGVTSMELGQGGLFSCQWSDVNDVMFRSGKKFDKTKTYDELGSISIDYACDFQTEGNSFLGAYGWMTNPNVEFMIVDSWGIWKPPGGNLKGTIEVDGGTYEVYQRIITTMSITDSIIYQNWSVRTTERTNGTISVSEHLKAWEEMGMKLGKMGEVSFFVEGYQSSGKVDLTHMKLSYGASPYVLVGDINGDKEINSIDFAILRKYLLGDISTFDYTYDMESADVNGDGEVNSIDFGVLRKYLLGMITQFPAS